LDTLNTVQYICFQMGITDRKQREREEMRVRILEAAKEIFLEKGYAQTSMRNIADRIEYSPGTIYLYFKEKDEIFNALHNEGFFKLLEQMKPLNHVADPFERLKAIGKVYMEFARTNKDLYDLMFITEAPLNADENKEKWEMGCIAFDFLQQVVRECIEAGRFKNRDVDYLSFIIWSGVHGMCALYCRQRIHVIERKDQEDLMKYGYSYFTDMLANL
jgi:AcrR family transcriptional regulator